ncbi:nucleolar protein 11-like [Gigantopelta aegis]|uniref:nucleolar protein 11-like n=1 Tax=Gigantopelta aegis TaxID=1735272 RepID=UPI001B88CE7B|nr:nucleolar protein 11-like [Gigantopelta aegis]
MAALRDGLFLANLPSENSLLGVEQSNTEDCVVVTCKTGFIKSYKLSDQKLLQSWSISHGSRISSPAVWNEQRQQLFTVDNKQVIKIWTNDQKNFEKAHKKRVKSEVFCVVSEEGFEPVVVCEKGKVDFFSKIKGSSSEEKFEEGEITHWCRSFKCRGNQCLVLISETKDKLCRIHYFQYQADGQQWMHKVAAPRQLNGISSVASCCLSKKQDPTLLLLTQNGDILECGLGLSKNTEDLVTLATVNIQQDASIVAVGLSHVAIAGIKNDRTYGLGIFDIKFRTLLVWKPFPEPVSAKPKLFCQHSCLFLTCSRNLYTFPYECEQSTLIKFLGQQQKVADITEKDTLVGMVMWSAKTKLNKSSQARSNENIAALLSDLVNREKTQTLSDFKVLFDSLVKELRKSINKIWVASAQMSELVKRCFQETKFWPRNQISQLVENSLISTREIPALFDALIAHKEVALLHLSLNILPDIPESSLVSCLQCYLGFSDEDIGAVIDGSEDIPSFPNTYDHVACNISAPKAHFINKVLDMPYSDVFLVEYLRNLKFQNTLVLLEYLLYLLKLPRDKCVGEIQSMPAFLKVIDWISLLLDTNLSQMVVSPDAKVLLIHLDKAVTEQVQLYDQFVSLSATLCHMHSLATVPTNKKVGHYWIEVLHVL